MADQTTQPEEAQQQPEPAVRSRSEIARELFGKEYKGKVPAETAPEETEEALSDDAKKDELPPAEEEPTEGIEPEEGEQPAPEEDTGETPIASVSELVEHLETSPEWFNGLKMSFSVDGTPTEATIGDLVESYQIADAARHRLEDAKATARKESEAWAAKQQELETHFQVLAELIKHEEANLERDVKAVDPKLRDEDPAEWAARREEFNERRAEIARIKLETVNKYQAVAETRARESQAIKDQFMAQQHGILLEKLPEWKDEKRADAEKAELRDYAVQSCGFDPRELADLIDHRHVMVLRKAMLYDKSRGQADAARKRVATVPKVMKPGAPKPAEQRASERLAALKRKLIQTGSIDDALAYRMAKRGVR